MKENDMEKNMENEMDALGPVKKCQRATRTQSHMFA